MQEWSTVNLHLSNMQKNSLQTSGTNISQGKVQ